MTYTEWCKLHNCDHAHCPCKCDHPQPFVLDDGRLICGQCALIDGFECDGFNDTYKTQRPGIMRPPTEATVAIIEGPFLVWMTECLEIDKENRRRGK